MDHNKFDEVKKNIYRNLDEFSYYSQMMILAKSQFEREFYEAQMKIQSDSIVNELENQMIQVNQTETTPPENELKKFTLEELATYNGLDGKPAYVAVNGTVYDMSKLGGWAGGTHFGQFAGKDLSKTFMECHLGVMSILDKVPKAGILVSNQ